MKTTIIRQGRMFKLKVARDETEKDPIGGKRGKVTRFTPASRKRLLEMFAKIDLPDYVLFLTLTYGQKYPSPQRAKEHLFAFIKRVKREFSGVSAVWRLEFQERGAPHFHLMMFGLSYWDKKEVAENWGDVIGRDYWDKCPEWKDDKYDDRPPFTRIEKIHGARRATYYVSKYVAKSDKNPDTVTGKCRSIFRVYEAAPPFWAAGRGFNSLAYLAVTSSVGRFWGVFNRQDLPMAEKIEYEANLKSKPVSNLKRGYRRFTGRKTQTGKGFTLFTNDSSKWGAYIARLITDNSENENM